MNKKVSQQGSGHVALMAIIIVIVIAVLGYLFWTKWQESKSLDQPSQNPVSNTTTKSDQKTFSFDVAKTTAAYSFSYPSDWKLGEAKDVTGGQTVSVTSPNGKLSLVVTAAPVGPLGGSFGAGPLPAVTYVVAADAPNWQGKVPTVAVVPMSQDRIVTSLFLAEKDKAVKVGDDGIGGVSSASGVLDQDSPNDKFGMSVVVQYDGKDIVGNSVDASTNSVDNTEILKTPEFKQALNIVSSIKK